MSDYLTSSAAAKALSCSRGTVLNLIRGGSLAVAATAATDKRVIFLFDRAAVEALAAERRAS